MLELGKIRVERDLVALRRKIGQAKAAESTLIRIERGERNLRADLDLAMEFADERTEVGLVCGSLMYQLVMGGAS